MVLPTGTEIAGATSSRISTGCFLILLMLFAVLPACKTPAWKSDPEVKAARAACEELPETERYACIERHAVETLNPDVCRLVGIFIDDACLQTVYESAGDPAICDRLYLQGIVPNCHAYYAGRRATPSPTRTAPVPSAKAATSYSLAELLDDLRTDGARVAPTDQMVDHGFEIKGRSVNLDAGRIFVYEFPDDAAAGAAASGISVGKYSLTITRQRGGVTIEAHGDWVEQPHVYTRGRLIVITGDHPELLPLLEASLGPECIGVCRSEEPSAPPNPASFDPGPSSHLPAVSVRRSAACHEPGGGDSTRADAGIRRDGPGATVNRGMADSASRHGGCRTLCDTTGSS